MIESGHGECVIMSQLLSIGLISEIKGMEA